ncbi:MAG: NAD(P)H-dependent oxidoreductase subunit E [Candidatus Bipolaricaulis sp.]|jgi:NADH:ubiquinone oxidoreductase subunit E
MKEETLTKDAIASRHPRSPEALLALLHDLQSANAGNYLTPDDLALAASHVGLPLSAVRDAATFYSMFSLRPRGQHIVRLCESPNCHLAGAWSALAELRRVLGVDIGETTPDGLFTLELTSCLGACGVAPVMMVDDEVVGNLTPARVREALGRYRGER